MVSLVFFLEKAGLKSVCLWGVAVHTYNPSILGRQRQKDDKFEPRLGHLSDLVTTCLKIKSEKGLGVWLT